MRPQDPLSNLSLALTAAWELAETVRTEPYYPAADAPPEDWLAVADRLLGPTTEAVSAVQPTLLSADDKEGFSKAKWSLARTARLLAFWAHAGQDRERWEALTKAARLWGPPCETLASWAAEADPDEQGPLVVLQWLDEQDWPDVAGQHAALRQARRLRGKASQAAAKRAGEIKWVSCAGYPRKVDPKRETFCWEVELAGAHPDGRRSVTEGIGWGPFVAVPLSRYRMTPIAGEQMVLLGKLQLTRGQRIWRRVLGLLVLIVGVGVAYTMWASRPEVVADRGWQELAAELPSEPALRLTQLQGFGVASGRYLEPAQFDALCELANQAWLAQLEGQTEGSKVLEARLRWGKLLPRCGLEDAVEQRLNAWVEASGPADGPKLDALWLYLDHAPQFIARPTGNQNVLEGALGRYRRQGPEPAYVPLLPVPKEPPELARASWILEAAAQRALLDLVRVDQLAMDVSLIQGALLNNARRLVDRLAQEAEADAESGGQLAQAAAELDRRIRHHDPRTPF